MSCVALGEETILFTRLGYAVAVFALVLGIYNFSMGLMIATGYIGPYETALAAFFPSKSTTGEVIDRGIYYALIGIGFGIVTEISYALRAPRAA